MKNKIYMAILIVIVMLQIIVISGAYADRSTTKKTNGVRYETMRLFHETGNSTLFVSEDGNMYSVYESFSSANNGVPCLVKLDGKNTETKTDDEILEIYGVTFDF